MRLKDKVAIVTGGGGGIGEGICLCVAREGANVIVSDLRLELAEAVAAKVKQMGRKALAVKTDVSIWNQCQALVDTTLKEMGRLDILACAHGVTGLEFWQESDGPPGLLETLPEKEWDLTLNVNLKGVFLCNKAVAPIFKKQKSGKIVNIASDAARRGVDWLPHYSASKAGVLVFSQAVAAQLAPFNVNVNSICPGWVWTPMWQKGGAVLAATRPELKGLTAREVFDRRVKTGAPLGRATKPEDIGNAVVFLVSDEASEITGQALNVDAGVMMN
jgi:NAD(P)-dependent dehydrogenase (short-subunit alcohol dehydrogenase family)